MVQALFAARRRDADSAACVARNPGNLDVAAFARMRAFPKSPNSGEFGYLPETTGPQRPSS
jgi:hypothetical protein